MTLPKSIKSCLVVSYGPVSTPQYQTVEGGGMRAWGLAEGLHSHGLDVTVAINNSFPQEAQEHEGVRLVNWGQDQAFVDLMNSYDAVIVSYCMGSDSMFIADNLSESVQLILDAYVPIYVEVSARDSQDIDTEYKAYMGDIQRFNHVLRRGDYFLCANNAQKTLYIGVLASLGVINPRSYRQDRILIAPLGVHDIPATATRNPYQEDLGIRKNDFVALWFGGLYPWFRVEELLDAVLELSKDKAFKFVIVGGKNPFNPNPDFQKQYDKAYAFAVKHKLLNSTVYFVDWVDFKERINWFQHAELVVSLNQPGEENGFSWRTRVMDFVWGELAIVTNGGDPLSEDLLAADAAIRLDELSADAIVHAVKSLRKDPSALKAIRKRIVNLKPGYYWESITKPVAALINAGQTPYQEEKAYRTALKVDTPADAAVPAPAPPGKLHKVARVAKLPFRVISYARRKGMRRSLQLAGTIARTQVTGRMKPRGKRYVFISHPIDNTGAPVVLLQMVYEYAAAYGSKNIHVIAPHVDPQHLRKLRQMGIKVDKSAMALGRRFIKLQLDLRKDDFVLMNTIAVYENYRDHILHELKAGHLGHAYWFIHEDKAQIPVINREFLQKKNLNLIRDLAEDDTLTLVTPSQRTREDYAEIFNTRKIHAVPLLVDVPKKLCKPRPVSDYKDVRFFISGTPSDGRKGQLLALAAFQDFMLRHYQKNPGAYRNFSITLLSIGEDYVSQQIRWIGESVLGDRIVIRESVPRDEALKLTAECNAVICASLNETFGLYVAEAMFMGHVVLRNDTAGMEEQLKEGVNGYFIDHHNIHQFADTLEKVLNKKTNSDADLHKMGAASQSIINGFASNNYLEKIHALKEQ